MGKIRTAVVTGSNSGIGLGVAHALAAEGHNVVINSFTDRDEDHALAGDISAKHGNKTVYIQADMSSGDACRALIRKAAEEFGRVDILVNNAGIQHVAAIEDFPAETWDRVIAINMNSSFHTTAAALPMMREHKWGRVINIASAHGLTASPFKSAYVTAKHGVVGMTKVVALETAEDPITCNAICPGTVDSPSLHQRLTATGDHDEALAAFVARQPMGRLGHPAEIAHLVLYLAHDASAYMTGQAINIDGGWTA